MAWIMIVILAQIFPSMVRQGVGARGISPFSSKLYNSFTNLDNQNSCFCSLLFDIKASPKLPCRTNFDCRLLHDNFELKNTDISGFRSNYTLFFLSFCFYKHHKVGWPLRWGLHFSVGDPNQPSHGWPLLFIMHIYLFLIVADIKTTRISWLAQVSLSINVFKMFVLVVSRVSIPCFGIIIAELGNGQRRIM